MVIVRSRKRQHCSPEYTHSMRVTAQDKLLVSSENSMHQCGMGGRGRLAFSSQAAEIVDALENDHKPSASLREHIAVKPGECVLAQPVCK